MIYSVPLQLQPQHSKGKAPVQSQDPTTSNAEFHGQQAQLYQLQQEKEAPLAQVQILQKKQAVNAGLLQHTATNVQNAANTSAAHEAQLSSSVRSQLDDITNILNSNFARIDGDLKKSFYNQNLIHHTIESRH